MSATTIQLADLGSAVGRDLGRGNWIRLDQARIDAFADVVGDHQWIHVDPVRASQTPFGGTIAHGYLTLAAAAAQISNLLDVQGAARVINYGTDRVRFTAPVPAGARIRAHVVVGDVREVDGGFQVAALVTVEAEGSERPACAAEVLIRFLR